MSDYKIPGGRDFGTPDFSDAVPPNPPNQGSKGPNYYTNPTTFESGLPPQSTAADESNWQGLVNTNALTGGPVDGYRTDPIGGSYNPGQGTSGRSSKDANTMASTERSNAS